MSTTRNGKRSCETWRRLGNGNRAVHRHGIYRSTVVNQKSMESREALTVSPEPGGRAAVAAAAQPRRCRGGPASDGARTAVSPNRVASASCYWNGLLHPNRGQCAKKHWTIPESPTQVLQPFDAEASAPLGSRDTDTSLRAGWLTAMPLKRVPNLGLASAPGPLHPVRSEPAARRLTPVSMLSWPAPGPSHRFG